MPPLKRKSQSRKKARDSDTIYVDDVDADFDFASSKETSKKTFVRPLGLSLKIPTLDLCGEDSTPKEGKGQSTSKASTPLSDGLSELS